MVLVSLVASDDEHLFMYLFALCMSSLDTCYSNLLSIFYWIYFFFFLLIRFILLHTLDINSFWDIRLANIFYHSVGGLFILFMVLAVQNILLKCRSDPGLGGETVTH